MSAKNPLVVVCAMAFLAGGAAALVFTRPAPGPASVHTVAAPAADAGSAVPARAVESAEGGSEGARVEEAAMSESAEPESESTDVGDEPSPTGVEGVEAAKTSGRTAGRAAAQRQAVESTRASRGYSRVSAGRQSSGRGGVIGYPVGGVKKTGEGVKKAGTAVGKTFGKVGGIFHE